MKPFKKLFTKTNDFHFMHKKKTTITTATDMNEMCLHITAAAAAAVQVDQYNFH